MKKGQRMNLHPDLIFTPSKSHSMFQQLFSEASQCAQNKDREETKLSGTHTVMKMPNPEGPGAQELGHIHTESSSWVFGLLDGARP